MLWDASEMKGYAIAGSDGHLGTVSDFLFDDTSWKIRWLVVDVGHWFPGREVLLPVSALDRPDAAQRQFSVKLTVQQVQDSPDIDCDLPVSRQAEFKLTRHYDSDPYRTSKYRNAIRNASIRPIQSAGPRPRGACIIAPPSEGGDPHLRSIDAAVGHHVHLTDGEVGHVDDFLIEDVTWSILYIKVDTRNWWPQKKVLIPPRSVLRCDWQGRLLHLDIDRHQLENSPPYTPSATADGAYHEGFLTYYGIRWVHA